MYQVSSRAKGLSNGSMGIFQKQVYKLVQKIPKGQVLTYGEIARNLGKPGWSRQVGWALHQNKQSFSANKRACFSQAQNKQSFSANKDPKVPCHRVVDRKGRLAPNFAFGGAEEQRRRLILEGVKFKDEMHVDLEECKFI